MGQTGNRALAAALAVPFLAVWGTWSVGLVSGLRRALASNDEPPAAGAVTETAAPAQTGTREMAAIQPSDLAALEVAPEQDLHTAAPSQQPNPVPSKPSVVTSAPRHASDSDEEPEARSVKCCDGTLSPSCVCGGKLRGCCLRHKGVCGCE